jgi:hypothetical protein
MRFPGSPAFYAGGKVGFSVSGPAIGTSFADAKVGAWSISSRRLRTLVCVESSHVAFVPL